MTLEENLVENTVEMTGNSEGQFEKERVFEELKKIDMVRKIMESKYPTYGILRDFINHLASTEKVFILAGIKNIEGEKKMDMLIDSETEVMAEDTGISKDVFKQIKEAFKKIYETANEISEVADELESKYNDEKSGKFIHYLEEELILLLQVSEKSKNTDFNISKEKEEIIEKTIEEMSQHDEVEEEKLRELYEEFKEKLNN